MIKINKKMEYALMALKYFHAKQEQQGAAQNGPALISAKDLAEITHTPFDVISRVLQALSSRGILKAEYGVSGGYFLAQDLTTLTVFDLISVLDSSTELAKCLGSESDCELSGKCSIVSPMTHLNNKVQNFYKSISIAEVFHV